MVPCRAAKAPKQRAARKSATHATAMENATRLSTCGGRGVDLSVARAVADACRRGGHGRARRGVLNVIFQIHNANVASESQLPLDEAFVDALASIRARASSNCWRSPGGRRRIAGERCHQRPQAEPRRCMRRSRSAQRSSEKRLRRTPADGGASPGQRPQLPRGPPHGHDETGTKARLRAECEEGRGRAAATRDAAHVKRDRCDAVARRPPQKIWA